MPYSFIYDLSKLAQNVLTKVAETASNANLPDIVGNNAKKMVNILKIDQITGLNLSEAITLTQDFIDVQLANKLQRPKFEETKRRAILIPHCSRAYMDRRCMADFHPEIPSYECKSCNNNCSARRATEIGKAMGYDVYIIPGGSCSEKILRQGNYQGVIGIACGEELKMAVGLLKKMDIAGQGVFLTKNGCANTKLNLDHLKTVL